MNTMINSFNKPPVPCGGRPPKPHCYPYNRPARDSYSFCCCGRVPNPPSSKFPTSGPFEGSGFALKDTNPYIIDTTYTSYGQVLCFSESVITNVTQRRDPSCINLSATFDMTDTNLTNTVRMDFLEKYTSRKYSALQGVLPIIKNETKFKVYYTITDSDGGVTYQGTAVSTVLDNHFHFTDIRDMYVLSANNLIIENIPAMTFGGLYTITIDKVEAYVSVINTVEHLQDGLNPYYTFYDNNMKIQLQHDIINSETADDEIMIAECVVNKSFEYQANVTTRLRMTFHAFMSTMIACGDTTGVWEALNSPTEEIITQLRNEMTAVEDEIKTLHEIIEQQNLLIQKLSGQIDLNKENIIRHETSINLLTDRADTVDTSISDLNARVTKLEAIPLALIPYKNGVKFSKGQLTWIHTGELYQITSNYTASGTFNDDIADGHLVPVVNNASNVTAITDKVNELETSVDDIKTQAEGLSTRITSISNTVTETTSTVEDNTNDINTNKENISSLESRVTTLENNESSGS